MARKTFLGFFGFKGRIQNDTEGVEPWPSRLEKIRKSDEDRPNWYAEPDIDRKAMDYIRKVHLQMNGKSNFQ
ncbi:hypothetical protein M5K25_012931 [Dendrobium thyrsiflorum]|uniref:Uncharacterized protein n=1 Tax=Dendrobium thyrsiflorum TaxID=117978 RepID=A0ABD0UYQ6_DENTH